ncbi:MAG: hypothetical protein KAU20_02155 [Nanoarchaeota archaeon]|nr:hypothetical protein [Nanoarchaeota archaeon]
MPNKIIEEKRKQRSELVRNIHLCEKYKALVAEKAKEQSRKLYINREIDYRDYKSKVYESFEGKAPDYWNNRYDSYISEYEAKVKGLTQDIRAVQRASDSNRRITAYTFIIMIMLMTGAFMFTKLEGGITGMATGVTEANVTILNAAPTVTGVNVTPDAANTTSNLTCTGVLADKNLDTILNYTKWYNNSIEVTELENLTTISYTNTTRGENWTCIITPFDGTINGTPANDSVIILNSIANVTKIEITDTGLDLSRMSVTPRQGTRANVSIRATIVDIDGNINQTVTAYICDTTDYAVCNETNYTYTQNLTYLSAGAGTDEYYYEFNGTDNMPQFWKQNGTWKLYVKVIDDAFSDFNETDFEYVELMAANYSTTLTLGDGSTDLGEWNNGTTEYVMTNFGNILLSIQWNTTNPTMGGSSGETWTLNDTDFAIDDDNNQADDTGSLTLVCLNATSKTFEPAVGLGTCASDTCANANATLNTYYHIAPPTGLKAGTYNSTITITVSKKT